MNELAGPARSRALSRSWTALLVIVFLLAIATILGFALPYFVDPKALARFKPSRHPWLFVHICAAGVALLIGPFQLWMGRSGRYVQLHRKLGMLYLVSVAVASSTGFYLAVTTQRGVIFAFALGSLTVAWVVATSLAYISILRRQFLQHWEWMIRSYVLTFVFVNFRLVVIALKLLKLGTTAERLSIAIWLAWAGPLLLTEAIIQGRKIFASKRLQSAGIAEPPAT